MRTSRGGGRRLCAVYRAGCRTSTLEDPVRTSHSCRNVAHALASLARPHTSSTRRFPQVKTALLQNTQQVGLVLPDVLEDCRSAQEERSEVRNGREDGGS